MKEETVQERLERLRKLELEKVHQRKAEGMLKQINQATMPHPLQSYRLRLLQVSCPYLTPLVENSDVVMATLKRAREPNRSLRSSPSLLGGMAIPSSSDELS